MIKNKDNIHWKTEQTYGIEQEKPTSLADAGSSLECESGYGREICDFDKVRLLIPE